MEVLGALVFKYGHPSRIFLQKSWCICAFAVHANCNAKYRRSYLDITSSSIQIQMQILNLAKLSIFIQQVLLGSFLMDTRHQHDPTLDCCVSSGLHFCAFPADAESLRVSNPSWIGTSRLSLNPRPLRVC